MKNIGIMTHCVATNYGANLQALSTARYLRKHGYNPIFIRWSEYLTADQTDPQTRIHLTFLTRLGFVVSEPCVKYEDFRKVIKGFDIHHIVVGSDCILTYHRKKIFPYLLTRKGFVRVDNAKDYQFPNPFWLPFLDPKDDVSLFMVSGSCGSSDIPKDVEIISEMTRLLNRFSYISVRDTYTRKMVRAILDDRKEIHLTPDPVFGFNANWEDPGYTKEQLRKKFNLPEKYFVLSYYSAFWPTQKWSDELMTYAHSHGIKCVSIPMPLSKRKSDFDVNIDEPLDPLEWYDIIRFSEGYVGNNMHPMIVALHNALPFFDFNIHGKFVLQKKIQTISSSKEYDLLKRFYLQKYQIAQQRNFLVSPKKVVDMLLTFDREYCAKCSKTLQDDYLRMMDTIINQIG